MTIPDNVIWGIISSLVVAVSALVGVLHKDIKRAISKLFSKLEPLGVNVEKILLRLEQHEKMHERHEREIEELKKNTQHLHSRIDKIENKITG